MTALDSGDNWLTADVAGAGPPLTVADRGTHGAQDSVKRRQEAENDVSQRRDVTSAPAMSQQVTRLPV
jgi:hypothetical protein